MNIFQRWIAPCLALLLMAASVVWAQSSPYTSSAIQAVPPNITARDFPAMMMLAASRDHTLFGPMYTDYEDLTGSGKIDPTFRPDFDYYGYFDSSKCYSHDGDKFVPGGFRDGARSCSALGAARWSGNFLNWATMTRIDVVRKMLYGGYRSTDTAETTVLELAKLGTDAHAFAKYYRGEDIAHYTPFSMEDLTKDGVYAGLTTCAMSSTSDAVSGDPILRMAKGNVLLWSTSAKQVCRWRPQKTMADPANADFWFGAKLVAYFAKDAGSAVPAHAAIAPFNDAEDIPSIPKDGGGREMFLDLPIRVQACVNGWVGRENCKSFSSGGTVSLKPSGILLDYGYAGSSADAARAEFGLISGSYDYNLSGGLLRKNMGNLNDEIKPNGTFCHRSGGGDGCTDGIIKSFDTFRLYGAGPSRYALGGSFSWVQPSDLVNKQFPSWGNPVGEMLIEALSYFANKGAVARPDVSIDGSKSFGLPRPDWTDPLNDDLAVTGSGGKTRGQIYGKSVCRPMSMLAVSSSAVSFDRDEVGRFQDLPNAGGSGGLASFTDLVGDREGITKTVRSVASNDGAWGEQCIGKDVTHLWQVSGICPQAPATGGSYLSAGAALYGNTRAIRVTEGVSKDIPGFKVKDLPSDLPGYALRVKTMAAAMGGGVARIEVVHPTSGIKAYITPESIWDVNGRVTPATASRWLSGAMLTIKLIKSVENAAGKTTAASYVVTWNDAQFGGDYDMDIVGYISYEIEGDKLFKVTTDILNVDGGMPGSHGFSVTGGVVASESGRYITHGSNSIKTGDCATLKEPDFSVRCGYKDAGMPLSGVAGAGFDNWAWPTKYGSDEVGFGKVETSSTRTFHFDATNTGSVLEDPLWYAAKYGSFTTGEDKFAAVSTATLPDAKAAAEGYFLARDPAKLELGLRKALDKILAAGNSTPAVSTAQLVTTSLKYVAEFDTKSHTGTVKAYKFEGGSFKKEPAFEMGDKLTQAATREVITNVGLIGVPLTVGKLGESTPTALDSARAALRKAGDPDGDSWQEMVNYVRGGAATGDLRKRLTNVLGPIVNAAPWLQRGALLRTTDVDLPAGWASYRDFAVSRLKAEQPSVLWVASNDSLLHAFKANDGTPLMSYLPSPLMGGLRAASAESTKDIVATMDGSPVTADVYVGEGESGAWKTYLFSSLGRGGRAIFALDVTDPAALIDAEDNAANVFKWMFSAEDDGDLGHILVDPVVHRASGQPSQVVRLNTGRFALMTPNGYGSSSGVAALFFLDVQGRLPDGTWGGGRLKKLVADASSSGNGMMGATWVDIDNNGTADWVYATDLKGQVWKFDISSSNPAEWKSSFTSGDVNAPMFQAKSGATGAGDPLPITTAPVVTFPGMGGVMIGFGTGKSIVAGDFPNTSQTQRFYSIWDRGNFGPASVGAPGAADSKRAMPTHTSLLGRKLVRDVKTGAVTFHADSEAATINWNEQDGWYLDFPVTPGQDVGTGEMVLSTPVVRSGILFFTTVWPDSTGEDRCQTDPFASLYAVSPTGGSVIKGLLPAGVGMAISDPKVLVVSDQTAEDTPPGEEAISIIKRDGEIDLKAPTSSGRVQWRVIPGLKTH